MQLTIAGEKASPTVAFRFEQDGNDLNVYASDVFVGWFDLNEDGKIQFNCAYISSDEDRFARNSDGELAAV